MRRLRLVQMTLPFEDGVRLGRSTAVDVLSKRFFEAVQIMPCA